MSNTKNHLPKRLLAIALCAMLALALLPTTAFAADSADLSLTMSVDNSAPSVGDAVTFIVVVTNNGPGNATGVNVTALLPAGLIYMSSTTTKGYYNPITDNWGIGNLANGETVTLAINVRVNAGGTLTLGGTVSGDEADPNTANNSASCAVIVGSADLWFHMSVDNSAPNVGDTVTFALTVINNGPDAATGVAVTALLPAGLACISANPSVGTYNATTGIWTIGTLANGDTVTLRLNVLVNAAGTLTFNGTVAGNEADPAAPNNAASCAVIVPAAAVSSVTVSPKTASVQNGNTQQFTATVAVTGNASTGVTWSVNSTMSTIDANGKLTVDFFETKTQLIVTATSTADGTKTDTAIVTVIPRSTVTQTVPPTTPGIVVPQTGGNDSYALMALLLFAAAALLLLRRKSKA